MFLADQQISLYGGLWLILVRDGSPLLERPAQILNRREPSQVSILPLAAGLLAIDALYLRPLRLDVGYNVPGAAEALNYKFRLSSFLARKQAWLVYGTIVPTGFLFVLLNLRKVPQRFPEICN